MSKPLPRTSDLREFRERYFANQEAVIVTGALGSMPAIKWTSAYLCEALGDHRPTVRLGSGRLAYMGMRDFFRYFDTADSRASSHGTAYLQDFYLTPSFGDAARARVGADIRFPLVDDADRQAWSREHRGFSVLYVGPAGSRSTLHADPFATCTWLAVISGVKAWRLAPPGALTEETSNRTNPFADEPQPCEFYEAIAEAGDVLYIPPNWWHAVENLTATIAVSGNFCTLEHAHACLDEVRAMPDCSKRDVWLKTWTAVLEQGAAH
jgi:hypothetical protein